MLKFPDPTVVEGRLQKAYPYHGWDVYAFPAEPDEIGGDRLIYVAHCNSADGGRLEIETIMSPSLTRGKYGVNWADFATDALVTHLLQLRVRALQAITGIEARNN